MRKRVGRTGRLGRRGAGPAGATSASQPGARVGDGCQRPIETSGTEQHDGQTERALGTRSRKTRSSTGTSSWTSGTTGASTSRPHARKTSSSKLTAGMSTRTGISPSMTRLSSTPRPTTNPVRRPHAGTPLRAPRGVMGRPCRRPRHRGRGDRLRDLINDRKD